MMKVGHELKILPEFYAQIKTGGKRFEIRKTDDRDFQKGDRVLFIEVIKPPIGSELEPSGKTLKAKITHVSSYNQPPNQVVFGFELIEGEGE